MSSINYWLSEPGLLLIKSWARDGMTQEQIADRMGYTNPYFTVLKGKHDLIKEALNEGKELTDFRVENALLKCALGYTTKEIKVSVGRKVVNGKEIFLSKETTTKEIPPNPKACMYWLTNKRPDRWKMNADNLAIEEDNTITISVKRAGESYNEEIEIKKTESVNNDLTDLTNEQLSEWDEL